jgi:diacylglycerol kinase family enzyme
MTLKAVDSSIPTKETADDDSAFEELRRHHDREIVLLCNPRAGGRWKALADILDSDEARIARRIVIDRVRDIAPALASMGERAKLVCIYGGDGTVQRVLDEMLRNGTNLQPNLAIIGGGTMNVTSAWCGMSGSPIRNFRAIVDAYMKGALHYKEVPLLEVRQGNRVHWGFTFGLGPMVRILDAYERGRKGKAAALGVVAKAVSNIWTKWPSEYGKLLEDMQAEIRAGDSILPFSKYTAFFCNITGSLNPGVKPFSKPRTRDTFHYAAYAVNKREIAMLLPLLVRGWIPMDPKSLLRPASTWKQISMSWLGKGSLPLDPRYINELSNSVEIRTSEPFYTIDGEILSSTGEPIRVTLGPTLKLAVRPGADLARPVRFAAGVTGA